MPKHNSSKPAPNPRRRGRERRISIRSELRQTPDLRKIARAVVALAMAQAEAEAQAERDADAKPADQRVQP